MIFRAATSAVNAAIMAKAMRQPDPLTGQASVGTPEAAPIEIPPAPSLDGIAKEVPLHDELLKEG